MYFWYAVFCIFGVFIFLFSAPAFTLGLPAGVGAELICLELNGKFSTLMNSASLFPVEFPQRSAIGTSNMHPKAGCTRCELFMTMSIPHNGPLSATVRPRETVQIQQ